VKSENIEFLTTKDIRELLKVSKRVLGNIMKSENPPVPRQNFIWTKTNGFLVLLYREIEKRFMQFSICSGFG
jgi:hypothetical protein